MTSTIGGVPVSELAETYGTPLFVYDGDQLAGQYTGLRSRLHPAVEILYSLKANPNISICAALHALGAGAEVSSLAELITALRAGVEPERIVFLGPGKSRAELAACIEHHVSVVVCESFGELELLDELAAAAGASTRVALRVNPEFSVKGSGLTMGGKPRQFGIDQQQILDEPKLVERFPHLEFIGIQIYLGTRILSEESIARNTEHIFTLAQRLGDHLGIPLQFVDIGGGLGVAYFDGEQDLDVERLTELLNPLVAAFHEANPQARIGMELGRYLTAPAGTYVVRVRYVKDSMTERFAVADGGTNHQMAAVGVGSYVKRNFPMTAFLDRAAEEPELWQVTGPLCTPSDTLGRNVRLPPLRPGDLVGVLRSGAYGPTASPTGFLSHGYPAEVLAGGGGHALIRTRDTTEDILRNQILHPPA